MMDSELIDLTWREAGRHLDAQGVWAALAGPLRQRMEFDWLLGRRFDAAAGQWAAVTTALVTAGGAGRALAGVSSVEESLYGRWLAWARAGQVLRGTAASIQAVLPRLLPEEVSGEVVLAPLCVEGEPVGVFALGLSGAEPPGAGALALLEALREPLASALAHDGQVSALERRSEAAEAERRALLDRLGRQEGAGEPVIGAETGLRVVMDRVELVARSDIPVLILGETGSGKEVLARRIHERSPRAAGPFLRVNCGAIPRELVDSELFGHERGSFTGAAARRQGWFERADGGTLFLDEVGELSLEAQVRLLRVLQDGSFQRVGGQSELRVDVRVVAATHRDLQAMVAAGTFRQDLWYRIAVFPLDLPALRQRREDIPALAAHFALRAARRFGLKARLPTPADELLLMRYDWPGNVRELIAVMERATLLGEGRALAVGPALGVVPQGAEAARPGTFGPQTAASGEFPTLDAVMADHIRAALTRSRGRVEGEGGAARLLGINPHTLRARMRKLGVEWSSYRKGTD